MIRNSLIGLGINTVRSDVPLRTRDGLVEHIRPGRYALTPRMPRDGLPYYCLTCGAGFHEYMRCDGAICQLESTEDARKRASK